MRVGPVRGQDVAHIDLSHRQRIRDQGTMTPPGDRLRTHDRRRCAIRLPNEGVGVRPKRRGLHVIRIAAKPFVAPTHVHPGAWPPAEARLASIGKQWT
jgi:hypothetical protein